MHVVRIRTYAYVVRVRVRVRVRVSVHVCHGMRLHCAVLCCAVLCCAVLHGAANELRHCGKTTLVTSSSSLQRMPLVAHHSSSSCSTSCSDTQLHISLPRTNEY